MDEPHAEHGDVFAERRDKLAAWRETGAAYPTQYQPRDEIASLHAAYESLESGQDSPDVRRIAGRVVARRVHGKLTFVVLKDLSGELQLFCQLDVLGEDRYAALEQIDLGDFVGAEGTVMRTRRGELSLRITSWQLLSKSLRPMPEKYHGLTRRRDALPQALPRSRRQRRTRVRSSSTRARIIAAIRGFLDDRGFIEVETPVLQPLYGGALAKPFVTHHNALDRDLYLRIATELYLKRLHRRRHRPRLRDRQGLPQRRRALQAQPRVHDARDLRGLRRLQPRHDDGRGDDRRGGARSVGGLEVTFREHEIDLTPPWPRLTMRKAIEQETGIDIGAEDARTVADLQARIKEKGLEDVVPLARLGRPGRRPLQ